MEMYLEVPSWIVASGYYYKMIINLKSVLHCWIGPWSNDLVLLFMIEVGSAAAVPGVSTVGFIAPSSHFLKFLSLPGSKLGL